MCDIRDATAEVERSKEQISVNASRPNPWNGKEHAMDLATVSSVSTTFGEPTCDDDNVPYGNTGSDEGGK